MENAFNLSFHIITAKALTVYTVTMTDNKQCHYLFITMIICLKKTIFSDFASVCGRLM